MSPTSLADPSPVPLALSWQRNSCLIPRRGCQTSCFCLTLRGTGTNRAALGSWEAILSPTRFSLLTGNLHQLFRLLSEGAEQTQPQQDTQVGAAWRNPGGTRHPFAPPASQSGLHPHLGALCVPWCVAVHIACGAFGASSSLQFLCVAASGTEDLGSPFFSAGLHHSAVRFCKPLLYPPTFLFLLCPSRVGVPADGHCPHVPSPLQG